MQKPVWQLKKEICDIGHRIWLRSFCAGNEGNHSVRIADDRILCTPTGVSKGFLEPDDIITCDLDGKQVEPNSKGRKPTSEIRVHNAIYKQRSDIKAVIHSHPPHAVAFCLAQMPLPEGIHPEAEVFLGKVPIAQYATPGTPDLPASILPLIGPETNTILMGNHGSVSFADTLTGAYYRLEILDAYCRQLLLAKQLGRINVLDKDQMTSLLKVKQGFGLPDSRLTCAPEGCIGTENQPFLTSFDVRPASAACACNGGAVTHTHRAPSPAELPATVNQTDFEALVQAITDQILTAAG